MPARPRLVRREPLIDRVKAKLNVYDLLLYISEELNSAEWEDFCQQWSLPAGCVLNLIFIIARANSTTTSSDDVFAETSRPVFGRVWMQWLASLLTYILALFSVLNTLSTFQRKRHYRLFEHSVDALPSTPSARRVKVDSSPYPASPFAHLLKVFTYPATLVFGQAFDKNGYGATDVWELGIWDPTALNLSLFCYFSPGHVLLYWMRLPLLPLDARPSVSLATTLVLALLFTVHLSLMRRCFVQQTRDKAFLSRQVQNEYDTKFVRPALNKTVRDVGVQTPDPNGPKQPEVRAYPPTTYVNRGFNINPNPEYSEYLSQTAQPETPSASGRASYSTNEDAFLPLNGRSAVPLRSSPHVQKPASFAQRKDGGSLGIYQHVQSPLKKPMHSRLADTQNVVSQANRRQSGVETRHRSVYSGRT